MNKCIWIITLTDGFMESHRSCEEGKSHWEENYFHKKMAGGLQEIRKKVLFADNNEIMKFTQSRRLLAMIALTTTLFLVEIIVGYITNSMALVADSFHMMSDIIALVIAYLSLRMSTRPWRKSTFGFARSEVLGALVNAVFLLALCFSIFTEAIKRFFDIEEITRPDLVLYVGIAGFVINVVGLALFSGHGHSHGGGGHGHSHLPQRKESSHGTDECNNHSHKEKHSSGGEQMNIHGVFLHILADALGSVIVIISALVIWLTDWEYRFYLDPALSMVLVFFIVLSTWPLFRESSMVLLQTVPSHLEVPELREKLLAEFPQILNVHEFHVWKLVGNRIIASLHIQLRPGEKGTIMEHMELAQSVKEFFHEQGIHSTTIQLEYPTTEDSSSKTGGRAAKYSSTNSLSMDCALLCPRMEPGVNACKQDTCCGPQKQSRKFTQPSRVPVVTKKEEEKVCCSLKSSPCSFGSSPYSSELSGNLETVAEEPDSEVKLYKYRQVDPDANPDDSQNNVP